MSLLDSPHFKILVDLIPKYDGTKKLLKELERSITVKAYSTKHSLTFILQIPSIDKSIYDLIHLYSIPDTEYLTIIPKSKFLALGSDEYAYLDNSCKSITESVHLCESLQMKSFTKSEDCIVNLIKHKNANCSRVKMVLGDSKIQKTRDNTWLVILKREEIVRAQCGTNTSYHRASGIHLITVTEDCRAEVANMTLQSHVTKLDLDEIIPLPQKQDSPVDVVRYQVKLQDLELDNVRQLLDKAEDLEKQGDINDWPKMMATPSWTTIILYLLLICAVSWKVYKKLSSRCTKNARKITPTSEDTGGSCKISFSLKDGGVTKA
ncbi:uncharacterized protein LOC123712141 [Pieris brassicae]|uniref:uncharacterized protein LOC123712141 n=1 Tax=Pieris brassicae TaxID=7116 RepID=UPI001E6616F3|nr:uncharacterized protein LOC123712141 [Pieris brassicae]